MLHKVRRDARGREIDGDTVDDETVRRIGFRLKQFAPGAVGDEVALQGENVAREIIGPRNELDQRQGEGHRLAVPEKHRETESKTGRNDEETAEDEQVPPARHGAARET